MPRCVGTGLPGLYCAFAIVDERTAIAVNDRMVRALLSCAALIERSAFLVARY